MLVIVVRPGARTQSILGWLRQLVPAALLVVAAVNLPPPIPPEVIVLDEEEVASGPLSLADVLTRRWAPSREPIIGGGDDLASRPVPPRS